MKCTKCESIRIVEGELDAFTAMGLRKTPGVPAGKSPGLWFRETGVGIVINICIDCGNIELIATNLDALQDKVEKLGINFKE